MPVALHYLTVKSSDAGKLIALEKSYLLNLQKGNINTGKKIWLGYVAPLKQSFP